MWTYSCDILLLHSNSFTIPWTLTIFSCFFFFKQSYVTETLRVNTHKKFNLKLRIFGCSLHLYLCAAVVRIVDSLGLGTNKCWTIFAFTEMPENEKSSGTAVSKQGLSVLKWANCILYVCNGRILDIALVSYNYNLLHCVSEMHYTCANQYNCVYMAYSYQ